MKTRMLHAIYFSAELRFWGRMERVCFGLAFLNLSKHKILHLEIGNTSHTYRRKRLCPGHSGLEIALSIVRTNSSKGASGPMLGQLDLISSGMVRVKINRRVQRLF